MNFGVGDQVVIVQIINFDEDLALDILNQTVGTTGRVASVVGVPSHPDTPHECLYDIELSEPIKDSHDIVHDTLGFYESELELAGENSATKIEIILGD